jgi:hypothetical protein
MQRASISFSLLVLVSLCAGCVERQMIITTEPFGAPGADLGAFVYDEQNRPLSASPADKSFIYYGKYRFKLVKDGYETLIVEENVRPPWYELPGLDFFSENLVPWTIRDVRRFHYTMKLATVVPPDDVLQQGTPLRERGKTVGAPLPPSLVPTSLVPGPAPPVKQGL